MSVLPILLLPAFAHAQVGFGAATSNLTTIKGVVATGGVNVADLPTLVGNLINVVLGTMGIVFVVLIIYAGILYLQAGSNPENAKKAKSLIINATIGLIIIVAAYAIASFIINQISAAGAAGTGTAQTPG